MPATPPPISVDVGWRTLSVMVDWIKHAEGKAAAALASCGVLGGLLYTLVRSEQRRSTPVVVLALISLALILAAGGCAAIALRPRFRTGGDPVNPLFYDHVARRHPGGPESYRPIVAALAQQPETLLESLSDQIWATARTARAKYLWADRALIALLTALLAVAATAIVLTTT